MFIKIAISLIGGVGLFLFGIQMMASGMQKAAGDRLRRFLEILTHRPIMGVLTGIFVTVLIQSSSSTTVMVVGFANAGLINLAQAVSVIIGANIGTTVTAQIVSFNIYALAYPAIGIGSFLNFFGRRRLYRYLGQAILGFGFLFLGIMTMSNGVIPLKELPAFHHFLLTFSANPLLGVLAGALFTAVIQGSGATAGVIIALSTQGLIPLASAIPLILGSNIGTCITAMLASVGTNIIARRAAVAHILFNVIGVALALIFINPFTDLVLGTAHTIPRQVANAHTIFNLANTAFVLLFFNVFLRLVNRIVPGPEGLVGLKPKYLDQRILKTPPMAIGGVKMELLRMASLAQEMLGKTIHSFLHSDLREVQHIDQMEELLDGLEKEINVYLAEVSQHSLTPRQSNSIAGYMSAANDLERIGDHSQNILQLAIAKYEERLPFTEAALEELKLLYSKVDAVINKAIRAFESEDFTLALEVIDDDDEIDEMEKELRQRHIQRINQKSCHPSSGVIYLDVLSNLERIADHANNLAEGVVEDVSFRP